ncbi:hypothetical protein Emag_007538 [Eimeria magna]
MARAVALAGLVALAAGQGLALPAMETVQMGEWEEAAAEAQRAAAASVAETISQTEGYSSNITGLPRMMGTQEATQQQTQDAVLESIMKEVQNIFKNTLIVPGWENMDAAADTVRQIVDRVRERLSSSLSETEAGRTTMSTAAALRGVTNDFLKEIMVQEAVIETLWAVLRDSQARPYLANEQQAMHVSAVQAVQGFLARMHDRLRATGFTEEEIMKMMPRTRNCSPDGPRGMFDTCPERNLGGRKGYGYGYSSFGYGGFYSRPYYSYSYPMYGYSMYSYPSYGYSSLAYDYPSYGYSSLAYPSYSYSSYPLLSYSSYSYPSYTYSSYPSYTYSSYPFLSYSSYPYYTSAYTLLYRRLGELANRGNTPNVLPPTGAPGASLAEPMMGFPNAPMNTPPTPPMMGPPMNNPAAIQRMLDVNASGYHGGYGGYGHGGYGGYGYGHGYGHHHHGYGGYGGYGGYPYYYRRLEVPDLDVPRSSTTASSIPYEKITENTAMPTYNRTTGSTTGFTQNTFRRVGETRVNVTSTPTHTYYSHTSNTPSTIDSTTNTYYPAQGMETVQNTMEYTHN